MQEAAAGMSVMLRGVGNDCCRWAVQAIMAAKEKFAKVYAVDPVAERLGECAQNASI